MRTESQETPIVDIIRELQAMDVPALTARFEELFGRPPRVRHKTWMWRRLAHRVQEVRFGGLSTTARRRLDELIAEIDIPLLGGRTTVGRLEPRRPKDPLVGTVLTREWHGREIRATALEDGRWEHDGITFKSLTAVALHVTGSHWSGPRFFGLKSRRSAK